MNTSAGAPIAGQGDIWDVLVEVGELAERPRQCPVCGLILTRSRTGRPPV